MTWTQVAICLFFAWTARAAYRDVMRASRMFPARLRRLKPAECGEGRPSEAGLVECEKPKRYANRSDAKVAREQRAIREARRAVVRAMPSPAENARRYAAEGGTW